MNLEERERPAVTYCCFLQSHHLCEGVCRRNGVAAGRCWCLCHEHENYKGGIIAPTNIKEPRTAVTRPGL